MFKERLRTAREKSGLSQAELAKKIGYAPTTYRNYENTTREPNFDTLKKIASILNVSTDYLLGMDNNSQLHNSSLMAAISKLPEEDIPLLYDYVNYLIFRAHTRKS